MRADIGDDGLTDRTLVLVRHGLFETLRTHSFVGAMSSEEWTKEIEAGTRACD